MRIGKERNNRQGQGMETERVGVLQRVVVTLYGWYLVLQWMYRSVMCLAFVNRTHHTSNFRTVCGNRMYNPGSIKNYTDYLQEPVSQFKKYW